MSERLAALDRAAAAKVPEQVQRAAIDLYLNLPIHVQSTTSEEEAIIRFGEIKKGANIIEKIFLIPLSIILVVGIALTIIAFFQEGIKISAIIFAIFAVPYFILAKLGDIAQHRFFKKRVMRYLEELNLRIDYIIDENHQSHYQEDNQLYKEESIIDAFDVPPQRKPISQ